jgi:hypothetical protein
MSRTAPNGPGRRSRPIKRCKPRGLGRGPISTATGHPISPKLPVSEPMSPAELAHHAASMTRRLPLS